MDGDIPDDFFDELADIKYEGHETAEQPLDSPEGSGGDSPQLARCLAEIDELQKKIQRRKRKLERDLTSHGEASSESKAESKESSRDRSNRDKDKERDRRNRERRTRSRSPAYRRRRSPSPSRHNRHRRSRSRSPRNNYRGGRGPGRNNRSKSPNNNKRAASNQKSLSFLDELALTFAQKGQEFPEKDLLMSQNHGMPMMGGGPPIDPIAMQNMNIYYPGLQQQYQNVPQAGFPNQPNNYYGINPMAMPNEPFNAMPPAMQNVNNNLHEVSFLGTICIV